MSSVPLTLGMMPQTLAHEHTKWSPHFEMHIVLSRIPDTGLVDVTLPLPPDYRYSFSGSGLPTPNASAAFDPVQPSRRYRIPAGTKVVELDTLAQIPNWTYTCGSYGPPHAKCMYVSDQRRCSESVEIHNVPRIPFRSLTPRTKLYRSTRDMPVHTQERLLRARGMPGALCSAPRLRLEEG